jgi:hypothetical protein
MSEKTTPSAPPVDEPTWHAQVRAHSSLQSVGKSQADSLEALLLACPAAAPEDPVRRVVHGAVAGSHMPGFAVSHNFTRSRARDSLPRWAGRLHASGAGYLVSALVAAGVTLFVQYAREEEAIDPIADLADVANQGGPRAYPADFDLEGDPAGFREIVDEVFPQQDIFSAELPKQLTNGAYAPSKGRFFTWSGEPGVSILLKDASGNEANPSTLYIVRLTDKNEKKFPRERTLKRVAGRYGKERKVNLWREGRYGYAMVQSVSFSE